MSHTSLASLREELQERYGHLPNEFLPWRTDPTDTQSTREWITALSQHFPSPQLPRGLKLQRGYHLQPPRFNFGWAMDHLTMRDIAYRCGFPAFLDFSGDEDVVDDDSLPEPTIDWDSATGLLQDVVASKFPDIAKDLAAPIRIEAVEGRNGISFASCIVLADSLRSGNRKPKQEHIDTLREFFGIGAEEEEGKFQVYGGPEPMWWLDSRYCTWRWKRSWEYEVENGLRDWRTLVPGGG
ncbi:ATP-dependent protease La [Coprinopsis cinerea AmutBmut pab1-1]|nr:ATP-dependent protease La [Coprinopsis cinerea AmutBmut pab1-1]